MYLDSLPPLPEMQIFSRKIKTRLQFVPRDSIDYTSNTGECYVLLFSRI